MKKITFLFITLLAATFVSNAQTKTSSKLGTSSKLSKNDSIMCSKTWVATSVEEWGVVTKPPGEKNKNDMLAMTLDGKFNLILSGNSKTGTWVRSGQYVHFTDETSGKKFSYKVVSVEPKKIKVDHYSEEEGHTILEMEPK